MARTSRGEPALTAGLIQGGHHVEVSAATGHQTIFIRWTWDSEAIFHELPARGRAPIHVVANDRDSRNDLRRFSRERDAVRQSFVTAREADAKQHTCRQQEPE